MTHISLQPAPLSPPLSVHTAGWSERMTLLSPAFTPKEFRLTARGCRASRLPRVAEKPIPYPKGVPSGCDVFESQSQTNHLLSAISSSSNNLDQHGDHQLWDLAVSC